MKNSLLKPIALGGAGLVLFLAGLLGGVYLKSCPESFSCSVEALRTTQEMAELAQQVPPSMQDTASASKPIYGRDIPSQLSKIHLAGVVGIAPKEEKEEKAEASAKDSMEKPHASLPVAGAAVAPTKVEAQHSQRALIDAPVQPLLIKTAEEYKRFKARARGSYPTVDFNKNMLLVLESASNLPDKVFEIDRVKTNQGKLEVHYRVNVLGLGEKINTHAVKEVKKATIPVVLTQIL